MKLKNFFAPYAVSLSKLKKLCWPMSEFIIFNTSPLNVQIVIILQTLKRNYVIIEGKTILVKTKNTFVTSASPYLTLLANFTDTN